MTQSSTILCLLLLTIIPFNGSGSLIACPTDFFDSFCYGYDATAPTVCGHCDNVNYFFLDSANGTCVYNRQGDVKPDNMVNNVYFYYPPSVQMSGGNPLLQCKNISEESNVLVADPYCILNENSFINQDGLKCDSCVSLPNRFQTTTTTTPMSGGSGGGGEKGSSSSTASVEIPRYISADSLTCHVSCNYATTGFYGATSGSSYLCQACASTCLKCTSLAACNECLYSQKRFQGLATVDNFLQISYAGALTCTASRVDSTKTLKYYVAPAGSTKRCSGGCSNSDDGTGVLWDDLNLVFKDIITQSSTYTSIEVYIYLLKSGPNLIHYLLDVDTQAGFYGYDYYTGSSLGYLPRPFERILASVHIQPIYCSTNPSQAGCLSSGEKPIIKWKSSMAHIFVTKSLVIENVIFDGADMTVGNIANRYTCTNARQECCQYDSTTSTTTTATSPSSCTTSSSDYSDWSVGSTAYKAKYYAEQKYGIFVFEYMRDTASAVVPSLTLKSCEIRNFFYSKYHTTFIALSKMAGNILIEDCSFDRFFFPHGLISNAYSSADRNLYGFSSFENEVCRGLQNTDQTYCHNITIINSKFTNYNPMKTTNLLTNDVHSIEGAVLAVHNLDGPITIYGCIFQNMLAYNGMSTSSSSQFDCFDFATNSWGASPPSGELRHDIGSESRYKIFLDKHYRKYAENANSNTSITAVIHIRNVTNGLVIHENTFDTIYTVVGGAIYIEGFNNTFEAPIVISENTFTNNFAQFIGANLFIYKRGYNIPRLNCTGIFVYSNTFTDNYGCYNTIGNVVMACEANNYNGYSGLFTTPQAFGDYYTTYAPTTNHIFTLDRFALKNFTRHFDSFSAEKDVVYTYTHPLDSTITFNPNKVTFINNVFERNYMKLSNGIYIQGATSLLVQGNTFQSNSIPTAAIYTTTGFTNSAFKLTSKTTPSMTTDSYMVESVPLIIRQSNYITIEDNIFDGNSQGFLGGDYYLAQAITLHQLIGKDGILIKNNTFKNHQGLFTSISDSTKGYFSFASSPLIAFNFWEFDQAYIKGQEVNSNNSQIFPDANTFIVSGCTFSENIFNFAASADTKFYYYNKIDPYSNYQYPFSHILKYFSVEEVIGGTGSSVTAFSSPVTYKSGPPMVSLHVSITDSVVENNDFANGFCAFNSFWFNQFNMDAVSFKNNVVTSNNNYYSSLICAMKETIYSTWNNGSTLTFSNISFNNDTAELFLLTSISSSDPDSSKLYTINIDTVSIVNTNSAEYAPITAVSVKNVSISSLTATSVTGNYGIFYLDSVSAFYVSTATLAYTYGTQTGLVYALKVKTTYFDSLSCAYSSILNTVALTAPFNWETFAHNKDVSVLGALVKQVEGTLSFTNSNFYNAVVPSGFLINAGKITFSNVSMYNISIESAVLISIASSYIYLTNSKMYNITGGEYSIAGAIVADSSNVYISGSYFYSISTTTNGLLLCQLSTISITNTNVSYLTVSGDNGIMKANLGKVTISGSYFGYNTGSGNYMIAAMLGTLAIDTSTFEYNKAAYMSSCIFVTRAYSTVKISTSKFIGHGYISSEDSAAAEFFYVFDTSLTLSNVTLQSAAAKFGAIYMDAKSYTLTLNFVNVLDNYATAAVISATTKLNILNSFFQNNTNTISIQSKNVYLYNVTFYEENFIPFVLTCTDASSSSIEFNTVVFDGYPSSSGWDVSNSTYISDRAGISLTSCNSVEVINSKFKNLITQTGYGAAIYMSSQTAQPNYYSLSITDSIFSNNLAYSGGSIYITNQGVGISQVDINSTSITSSYAVSLGGGIYYDSFSTSFKSSYYTAFDESDYMALNSGTTIVDCAAVSGGGAIYYTQLRPDISLAESSGTVFSGNTAVYGPNWGSYPVNIIIVADPDESLWETTTTTTTSSRLLEENQILRDTDFNKILRKNGLNSRALSTSATSLSYTNGSAPTFVSGQQLDPPLVLALIDIDGQIVGNWGSSVVTMTYGSTSVKSSASTELTSASGFFVLKPYILAYTPGLTTTINFTTSVSVSSGILSSTTTISKNLTAFFRLCSVGERLTDVGKCELCPSATALFQVDSTDQCVSCPSNMECLGGAKIAPVADYSRFSRWNDRAIACLNSEACIGSTVTEEQATSLYCSDNYNTTYCQTGWCSAKYKGNLCAQCTTGNVPSGSSCVSCSNNPGYYVLTVFIVLGAAGFIIFTVRNALKLKDVKKDDKKPKISILIKILLNYVQLVSIVGSFSFEWPAAVKQMFNVQTKVSSSASEVFSVDCLLPQSDNPTIKPVFTKLLIIVLSPIFLMIAVTFIWIIIIKLKKTAGKSKLIPNVTTTCIILLFMIHTTLVQTALTIFRCKNIGDASGSRTEYYMESNLDVECWVDLHLFWSVGVALPAFILWGIGIPLIAYIILKKNRDNQDKSDFKSKYGFLYDGYRKEKYFWELVIVYRKILMVVISVFMVTYGVELQALSILGLSFVSYLLHVKASPFVEADLNLMEKKSLINATLTLYCGVYYISGDLPNAVSILLLIVIIGFNAYFFISWGIVFVKEIKNEYQKRRRVRDISKQKPKQGIDLSLLSVNSGDANSTKKELKIGMSDMLDPKQSAYDLNLSSVSPSNEGSTLKGPKFFRGANPDVKKKSIFEAALRNKLELTDDLSKEQL